VRDVEPFIGFALLLVGQPLSEFSLLSWLDTDKKSVSVSLWYGCTENVDNNIGASKKQSDIV
jgi:hypothetical protein